jgi:hypothetical protein
MMALYNADLNVSGTLTVPSGIFSDSVTVSGASVLTSDSVVEGGGGSALTVQDQSGSTSASDVSTIKVTDGTLVDDGGGVVSIETGGATIGGIPTTASGAYWSAEAPPEYPSPFDDEFDTFTDNPTGTGPLNDISDEWTQFNPGGNLSFDHLFVGDGISEAGLGFGAVGNATPTWNGFVRPIGPMAATASGGQNYWFDAKISLGERPGVRNFAGLIIGGDLINNPTTEEFIYVAVGQNDLAGTDNSSNTTMRASTQGVLYNTAINTSAVFTDGSGPNTTSFYLRLQYDAVSDGYSASYSTDGAVFSSMTDTLTATSGSLNFTPQTVGIISRNESAFGSAQAHANFFRFRTDDDRNAGTGRISTIGVPVNGRRIYTNPVAAIPSDLIAVSGTFDVLTVGGDPITSGLVGRKAFNGALIRKTIDQVTNTGDTETIEFEETTYDSNNWADLANNRFVVPEGVIKVNVSYCILWRNDSTAGLRSVNTAINGSSQPGVGFTVQDAPNDTSTPVQSAYTAAMEVSPGDFITLISVQDSGVDVDIRSAQSTWFAVEAAETNESFQIDDLTAVSGTFTQSLTISGVPVSTGTGGGSSSIDDVNGISTGSVTITGAGTVETITEGNVITVSGVPELLQDNSFKRLLHVQDLKAVNTPGGTFTQSGFETRDLNTITSSGIVGATLVSNQIILQPGTYYAEFVAPAFDVGRHKAYFFDVDGGGSVLIQGSSEIADTTGNVGNSSVGAGKFTITAEANIEIRHRCQVTKTTSGFGLESNHSTFDELYTDVRIWPIDETGTSLDSLTVVSGTFTESLTVSGVAVDITGGGGGGSALTVKEADGDPLVANVDTIVVTNGTLTDDGGGQVTIDIGSGGSSPGFLSAMLSTSSGVDIEGFNIPMNWDTVLFDTDGGTGPSGMVDLDADDQALVTPVGSENIWWVAKAQVRWESVADTNERVLNIFGVPYGMVRALEDNSTGEVTHQQVVSYPFQVPAGRRIFMGLGEADGTPVEASASTGATWLSMEQVAISGSAAGPSAEVFELRSKNFSGVVVSRESDSDQAISGNTLTRWTDVPIDTDGFYDGGTNTRLTVPSGKGIKKVVLTVCPSIIPSNLPATTSYATVFVRKNTIAMVPDLSWRYPMTFDTAVNNTSPLVSGPIAVSDGDYFEVYVGTNAGGSPTLWSLRSYFSLEVVERDAPFTMGELTAVSGTFTESLTISGSPVATGTSTPSANFFLGAMVLTSSGVSIPNAEFNVEMIWDTQVYDFGGLIDLEADDHAFIIPAEYEDSFWVAKVTSAWENVASVTFRASTIFGPSGGFLPRSNMNNQTGIRWQQTVVTPPFMATAGTRIRCAYSHGHGSPLDIEASNGETFFSIERVGVSGTI